jgi:IclR family transcriptional regulator, acetate operon repressor
MATPTATDQPTGPRVQSVSRAMAILVAVATSPHGLTAKEISERLGLNRPTTYHLLRTLQDDAFLVRGTDRRHRLGLRVGTLVEGFARQLAPDESLTPYVRLLAERTGEGSYLTVRRGTDVILLTAAAARHVVQAAAPVLGRLDDLHARASGKVSLAWARPETLAEYLRTTRLTPCTPNTITDPEALASELERIRAQGYAVSDEERELGVCTMAAPIDAGASPFVLAFSAPRARFHANFARYREMLLEVAAAASSDAAEAPPVPA